VKNLLFDLDGTLIDSRADLACAVNLTRQDFGLPPRSTAEVVACVGEGVRLLIERAIPERPDLWEAMLVRQRVHYVAHCLDRTVLYPGVADTLEALCAAGWRLAVVTNKPGPVTRPILEGLGIARFFGAWWGAATRRRSSPTPPRSVSRPSGWASRWTLTTGWRVTILPTLRPAGAPACAAVSAATASANRAKRRGISRSTGSRICGNLLAGEDVSRGRGGCPHS